MAALRKTVLSVGLGAGIYDKIIDDALPSRSGKRVLESAGFNVISTLDLTSALALLRMTRVDVVVLAHLIDKATRSQLARSLREASSSLPIVLLFRQGEEDLPASTLANAYVSSHAGPEALLDTIVELT